MFGYGGTAFLFGSIVPLLCSGRGVIGNDERAELNLRQVLN